MVKECIDLNVKEVLDEINNNKCGVFDKFYEPYIDKFANRFIEEFELIDYSNMNINFENILKNSLCSIKNDFITISNKALIGELYKAKSEEQLKGDTSSDRYKYFEYNIDNEMLEEKYPVLKSAIETKIETKKILIINSIKRLVNDIDSIRKQFNMPYRTLCDIKLDSGDTHNGGQSVIIFEFENNEKVVYKPHSLSADKNYEKMIEFINKKNALDLSLTVVNTIDREIYGWQQFVYPKECFNEIEVKNYYYRLGATISLLYLLKGKDIHKENIIANGEYPEIIDLEAIMYNNTSYKFTRDEEIDDFSLAIEDSIYSSLILPQNLELSPLKIDLCGISGGGEGKSDRIKINDIINVGTDEIQYSLKESKLEKTYNRVVFKGEEVDSALYYKDLIKGFRHCYKIFLKNKNELRSLFKDEKNFEGIYRQVLRPTYKYAKFFYASLHPYYLSKEEERKKLFSILYGKNKLKKEAKFEIDLEVEQLLNNDIPYFYTTFVSKDLKSINNTEINGYYSKSIQEILIKKLDKLSEQDLKKQEFFIKASMASIAVNNKYEKESINVFNKESKDIKDTEEFLYELAKDVEEYITKNNIIKRDGKCLGFYTLNEGDNSKMELGNINSFLYEGAGVVLFLMQLYKLDKLDSRRDIIEQTIDSLNLKTSNIDETDRIGVFDGLGSVAYLNYNAYKTLGLDKYLDNYNKVIKKLNDLKLEDDLEIDLTSGVSGLIIMLLNIYEKDTSKIELIDLSKKYGEYLYNKLSKNQLIQTGFAHGFSGYSSALIKLAHYTEEEKYYNMGIRLIAKENEYFDESLNNWLDLRKEEKIASTYWCHGAPGIILSRASILKYLRPEHRESLRQDIKRGLIETIENGINLHSNNSLCHGNIGNLEILLKVSQILNDYKLECFTKKKIKDVMELCIEEGIMLPTPLGVESINFMTGLSGIGYSLLRASNMNIPCILCLESE